ncbi:MAG: polysaccharide biosynthesis C-terminal domain-containing protein [Bacteroidia bacterium]|nr:polysaccharide biosynthesis C-terminal domain-containing protein [Bacteroidia bacterium]
MQRKFLGNLILLQALNWAIKPLWIFWIERTAQVHLGDDWYGRYFVIFNFGLLFNILLDFGLNNFVASRVGESGSLESVKPVLRLRMWLAGIYVLLVAGMGLFQAFDPALLMLVLLNQILAGFILYFRAVLQGRHLFRTDSIVSVTDRLIAISLMAVFLCSHAFAGRQGLLWFLGAQTAGYAVALLVSVYYSRKGVEPVGAVSGFNWRELMQQTAWFALLAFAMSVFTRIDALMIRNLTQGSDATGAVGYAEAGRYARAFRLLDAALIFSSLIATQLLPIFSRMLAKKENTDGLLWLNTRIVLFVALPAALAATYFGAAVWSLMYGKVSMGCGLTGMGSLFRFLLTCFVPMALVHIFGTWLTAAGRLRFLAIVAIAAMALNVACNFMFIPRWGAGGAAISCLITQCFFAVACIVQCFRLGAMQISWQRALLLSVWVLGAECCFGLWYRAGESFTFLLAAGATYLCFSLVCGIFWPEIRKMMRRGVPGM